MEYEKEEGIKGTINKFINRISNSKDKTKIYLLIIFLSAFIIRLIAAKNMGLYPDDSIHSIRPIGIIGSGKLVEYGQSSALWYYIQEIFYKIFGASIFGSRIATAIFGSFFVILIFLFVKQIFKSKKAGLIAAVLMASSPFLIRMTLPEMDLVVMFFIIFSALFLFKFTEDSKKRNLILCGALIGIAILIKIYALLFVLSFLLFLIYSSIKTKNLNRKRIKIIIIFLGIIFLFCIPTLTHNYLLYKDKGFVDMMFTNMFKVGLEKAEVLYGWGAGWLPESSYTGLSSGILKIGSFLYHGDVILLILGLLGFIFLFRKNKDYLLFFLFAFIIPFVYIGSQPVFFMSKHFTFVFILFIPMASALLEEIFDKSKIEIPKLRLRHILFAIIIFNLIFLINCSDRCVYKTSGESQLMKYKEDVISEKSLVVVDSRIYRGFISWIFHDRNYIEAHLFNAGVDEISEYGNPIPIETYFIECVKDDCGWGVIKDKPKLNQSMESLTNWFASNSYQPKEIKDIDKRYYLPVLTKSDNLVKYRIYKANLILNPYIINLAMSTHISNLYPIGYDERIIPVFDKYETHNSIDSILDKFAHLIFYISFLLSFLSLPYLIYLIISEETNQEDKKIEEDSLGDKHEQ